MGFVSSSFVDCLISQKGHQLIRGMLRPRLPTPSLPAALAAARRILGCREVRRAAARVRGLRLAPGPKPSPSAASRYSHCARVQTQGATFPSAKARAPMVDGEVDEPINHIREAAEATHPEEADNDDLPRDVVRAARTISDLVANRREVGAERRRVLKVLRRVKRDLRGVNERLQAVRPPHISGAPQIVDAAFLHALACAVSSPDTDLAALFVVGFPPVGDIPPSGWWEELADPASLDLCSQDHDWWVRRLEAKLRGKMRSAQLHGEMVSVREKTLAEVERGLAAGPFSRDQLDAAYGVGLWRPMQRFGVLQKGKVRPCDNARQSLSNEGTTTREKLRCDRADFPARVARLFAQLSWEKGRPLPPLLGGTDDLADAYRHVPCSDPRFTVVAAPDPRTGKVEYFTMSGFNFGLKSAVLCFNRFPECMTAVARQLLAVVCTHYYDDFAVVEPACTARGGQEALREIMKLVAFPFSAAKAVDARRVFTFLGVCCDLSSAEEGVVAESRRARLTAQIKETLESGAISGAQLASMCGKLQFTLSWAFGKVGRACMQPLHALEAAGGGELRAAARAALSFLSELIPRLPPCRVHLAACPDPPVLVWTDGAFEQGGTLQDVGFLVLAPRDEAPPFEEADLDAESYLSKFYTASHGCGSVPAHLRRCFCEAKQKINQVEIVAALCPYLSLPDVFVSRPVIHWVDNTAALSALVKGYSRASDSAHLVHAFHARNSGARARVWFEWVKSAANPADEPSRNLSLAGKTWRLGRRLRSSPVDVVFPELAAKRDSQGWFKESSAARAGMGAFSSPSSR